LAVNPIFPFFIFYCTLMPSFRFDSINRAQFMDQVYSHVYGTSSTSVSVDRLSLLFIILALGTLLDVTKPYDIRRTEPYYQLGKAAFCLEPLIEAATIPTIQALASIYPVPKLTRKLTLHSPAFKNCVSLYDR
jgi:hypothetical protein